MISSPIDLTAIETFSYQLYAQIGLNHLLAYTVYFLYNHKHPVTFENIVVTVHRMFPAKYSLVGYPQYPDAARVQLVILHLGPKYVGWLNGKKKTGYYLNTRGLEAVREITELLQNHTEDTTLSTSRLSISQDNIVNRTAVETRLNHIKESNSYNLFCEGKYADLNDVSLIWDALQLFISADDSTKAETYSNLRETAKRIGDEAIIDFLAWIEKNRPHLVGKSGTRRRK